VEIEGESLEPEVARVVAHLDRVRDLAGGARRARVASTSTFPRGTGLSSSGSGFAALTCAAADAAGLALDARDLSILARLASGTACRCVCGGFVKWHAGRDSDTSFAETLWPPQHWDLRDVVVVVDEGRKRVSSTEGHRAARSSPFFEARQAGIGRKTLALEKAIADRDFERFADIVEAEALEFHSILLTSRPSLIAWYPGTVAVMLAVQDMRRRGVPVCFTVNTGFNVHAITTPGHAADVRAELESLPAVRSCLEASVGGGPVPLARHLF